jgi:hypothetical protein
MASIVLCAYSPHKPELSAIRMDLSSGENTFFFTVPMMETAQDSGTVPVDTTGMCWITVTVSGNTGCLDAAGIYSADGISETDGTYTVPNIYQFEITSDITLLAKLGTWHCL